ncbi:MAG: hypothetical protein LC634_01295 [Sphingomonadales bacterium]|nr:hypothetical protein [Sphingomonadales bacterium]
MLTRGDDYPLHQSAEPVAFAGTDRNFYDRYFFNGYSADGSLFFAAAMGIYPQLDIIDASFCVMVDGVQHNLRASRRMGGERLDLAVGPIRIEIVEPLARLRLVIEPNDGPLTAHITFAARHAPIEEPRFTRRQGTRLFMDYTRLTQNGGWEGRIACDGATHSLAPATHLGTRDRSWGIRPVGAADSQPPPAGGLPQFFWLWAPLNFADHASFFHTNDDGAGVPWNRRAVVDALGGKRREFGDPVYTLDYRSGTRRVSEMTAWLCAEADIEIILRPTGPEFLMSGLGYTHPEWGHGMDHGADLAISHDTIDTFSADPDDRLHLHIQAFAEAVLKIGREEYRGHGVLEQLLLGPHEPSGFASLLDPAA